MRLRLPKQAPRQRKSRQQKWPHVLTTFVPAIPLRKTIPVIARRCPPPTTRPLEGDLPRTPSRRDILLALDFVRDLSRSIVDPHEEGLSSLQAALLVDDHRCIHGEATGADVDPAEVLPIDCVVWVVTFVAAASPTAFTSDCPRCNPKRSRSSLPALRRLSKSRLSPVTVPASSTPIRSVPPSRLFRIVEEVDDHLLVAIHSSDQGILEQ
jgi:hypothetical protein